MSTATLTAPSVLLVNDLLTGAEWGAAQTRELLALAADVKAHPERYATTLRGKTLAMIFEKPSLRTRVTFEVGIQSMGGSANVNRSRTWRATSSAGCRASSRVFTNSGCWKKWRPTPTFR